MNWLPFVKLIAAFIVFILFLVLWGSFNGTWKADKKVVNSFLSVMLIGTLVYMGVNGYEAFYGKII